MNRESNVGMVASRRSLNINVLQLELLKDVSRRRRGPASNGEHTLTGLRY